MSRTTIADEAHRLRETTDVRALVRRLRPTWTPKGRDEAHELHGPCPKCAGEDRFYVGRTYAACRQCHAQRMDAAGLVAWLQNVPMHEAVRQLVGGDVRAASSSSPAPTAPAGRDDQTAQWRLAATRHVREARQRLSMDGGAVVRRYLLSRALQPATWRAFELGCVQRRLVSDRTQTAPAVSWPVYDEDTDAVVAVRYRYAVQTATGDRYDSRAGSRTKERLFGVQCLPAYVRLPDSGRCAERLRCLVLCEGEINAISVWQACHRAGVDVLSTGSESQNRLPAWSLDVAARYGVVLAWFDREDIAATVAQQLRQCARVVALRSPVVDGDALDANDLLQRGRLAALVHAARLRALDNDAHERQRVLWQIHDSVDGQHDELDEYTERVVASLVHELDVRW